VSLLSRRQAENETAQKLAGQQSVRYISCTGSLTNAADVTAALDKTCKQPGGINYTLNHAGIEQHYTSLAAQTKDD